MRQPTGERSLCGVGGVHSAQATGGVSQQVWEGGGHRGHRWLPPPLQHRGEVGHHRELILGGKRDSGRDKGGEEEIEENEEEEEEEERQK